MSFRYRDEAIDDMDRSSTLGSTSPPPPLSHERYSDSTLLPEPISEVATVGLSRRKRGMPSHMEEHSKYGDIVRDVIIGFADGLTVPFALTASLSSLGSAKVVIVGGLAELFSGAISMGLGAYLAAVTEREHYLEEEKREWDEVQNKYADEEEEIYEIMEDYEINREATKPLVDQLVRNPEQWVRFMMDFELKLQRPNASRAWISAATMGIAYFIGGFIPMSPYFIMEKVTHALFVSIGITVVILLFFGYIKNIVTIGSKRGALYGALQTLLIGVLAAGTSYGIVVWIDHSSIGGGDGAPV